MMKFKGLVTLVFKSNYLNSVSALSLVRHNWKQLQGADFIDTGSGL
jgi:hypothetical protein